MVPEKRKPGKVSKHIKPIEAVLNGKRTFITFLNRSAADNCATYFRGHYSHVGKAFVRSNGSSFRVYIEKEVNS